MERVPISDKPEDPCEKDADRLIRQNDEQASASPVVVLRTAPVIAAWDAKASSVGTKTRVGGGR